jgi:hypothetical protein
MRRPHGRRAGCNHTHTTFDSEITIHLGGQEISVFYLGPAQNPGDRSVLFPHDRATYTLGAFAKRSWANTAFTPSVESWTTLLNKRRQGPFGPRRLSDPTDVAADSSHIAAALV